MSAIVQVTREAIENNNRLTAIEARIGVHMQGAYENMLEVGRCLCEAKDGDLIRHGEWEAWVLKNTGFSVRQAQRLMQAARAVPAGSVMNGMPISKVQVLLALPEEQREEVAKEAIENDETVRELQRKVESLIQHGVEREKNNMMLENTVKSERAVNKRLDQMLGEERKRVAELEELIKQQAAAPSTGISDEAQAKIDDLTERVRKLNDFAADQARKRQQAERSLLTMNVSGGRSDDIGVTRITDVISSIRSFLGSAGIITQMGTQIAALNESEWEELDRNINLVREWVKGADKVMDAVVVNAYDSNDP